MDNGDKENASPNKNKVHIKHLLISVADHACSGRPQGFGTPLEHPSLVAKHDVWRRRRRPIDAQSGNPQQISSWHRHFKLHAFQPSVHTKGSVLYSTLYLGWLAYAIFTVNVFWSNIEMVLMTLVVRYCIIDEGDERRTKNRLSRPAPTLVTPYNALHPCLDLILQPLANFAPDGI